MAAKSIGSLKGWTIQHIVYSAGYYTMTLTKGERTQIISVDRDQLFDRDGNRFTIGNL